MRADSVHLVEQPLALFIEFAFNPQRRKFVRHHSDGPTRSVRTTTVPPVYQHVTRGFSLVSGTKRTVLRILWHHGFGQELHRPLATLGRNNHPAACNRVFPQRGELRFLKSFTLALAAPAAKGYLSAFR